MRSVTLELAGLTAVLALIAGCERFGGEPTVAEAAAEQWPIVDRYCTDCHNAAEFAGDVDFETMGPDSVAQHAETLEKAVRKLRGHLMPPPKEPRPDEEQLASFVSWLERALDEAAANHASESIVPHRLNRKEYANAVRDLLALEIDPVEFLPQDEEVEHFDNIASGLQVSPSFIEQYVIAARAVAVRAVGRPDARPGSQTYRAGPGLQQTHVKGLPLGTRGGLVVSHLFPSDGEYVLNIADVAGQNIWGNDMEFENNVVVTLDGKLIHETVIGGEEDMRRFDQILDGAFDVINGRLKNIRFAATAGPHEVGVTFRRRTFAESDDQLQMFVPGGGQDRVYRVSSVEISGPFNASGLSSTPSREKIFTCHPERGDDERLCAEQIITEVATRAFRRPLAESDVAELLKHYRNGLEGGFEQGIRAAITGILASPYFLYRVEQAPESAKPGELYRIDAVTLASKLSFFLWNTVPDDELLGLAMRGELSNENVVRAQVERMLGDPRAETLASNFVYQWLDLKRLEEVEPDRAIFPYASGRGDPRDDYLTELTLFAQSIFDEDRSVVELLTAEHTYLNERVALLYGINDVKGDRFRRVKLTDSRRWGLLGKGAVLMAAAYPNRTSPVLRGAFILEHISGTPPAAPPPNVEAFPENDIGTAKARTVREIIAKHREDPNCYACHGVMDPLGFALENFDAVGAWRDKDRYAGSVIDAAAELPDGTPVNGPDDLRKALLRRPEQFVQTFTERLLMYALGRTIEYRDMPAVRNVVREAARDDYRLSSLVWQIVRSEPFQMRRAPEQAPTAVTARNVTAE